jgi:hypothetical protein
MDRKQQQQQQQTLGLRLQLVAVWLSKDLLCKELAHDGNAQ